jgi:hypothetical protein
VHIEQKWPEGNSLEVVMAGLFERLKTVRDLDKKHIQRRAFIDLLKFMKDQGLKANFQEKLQPLLLQTSLTDPSLSKYYYKAHELLLIMHSASQVDDQSDLKNSDVIRIQGFTMSLMERIIKVNQALNTVRNYRDQLKVIPEYD